MIGPLVLSRTNLSGSVEQLEAKSHSVTSYLIAASLIISHFHYFTRIQENVPMACLLNKVKRPQNSEIATLRLMRSVCLLATGTW